MVNYTITLSNLHLIDSWKSSKWDFKEDLEIIRVFNPDSDVWNRSITGMCLEWATHNALYACHIARDRTKDCDLNYPQNVFVSVAYTVFGIIVWPFIK